MPRTDIAASRQRWDDMNASESLFWKPEGSKDAKGWVDNYIRILPGHDEMNGQFYFPSAMHYRVGAENARFLCPRRMANLPCPICAEGFRLLDDGQKDAAKAFWPSMQGLMNIVVLSEDGTPADDPPQVKLFAAPKSVMDEIFETIESKGYGDFTDPEKGRDIVIKRQGQGPRNTDYRVEMANEPSEFDYPEALDEIQDLRQINVLRPIEEMQAALAGGTTDRFGGTPAPAAASLPAKTASRFGGRGDEDGAQLIAKEADEITPGSEEDQTAASSAAEPEAPAKEKEEKKPAKRGRAKAAPKAGAGAAAKKKLMEELAASQGE